jgi:hypothetical protein
MTIRIHVANDGCNSFKRHGDLRSGIASFRPKQCACARNGALIEINKFESRGDLRGGSFKFNYVKGLRERKLRREPGCFYDIQPFEERMRTTYEIWARNPFLTML